MLNHPPERLNKFLRDQWFKGLMLEIIARDQQARNENDLNSCFISKCGGGANPQKVCFLGFLVRSKKCFVSCFFHNYTSMF